MPPIKKVAFGYAFALKKELCLIIKTSNQLNQRVIQFAEVTIQAQLSFVHRKAICIYSI